jgi:hypothetical protein
MTQGSPTHIAVSGIRHPVAWWVVKEYVPSSSGKRRSPSQATGCASESISTYFPCLESNSGCPVLKIIILLSEPYSLGLNCWKFPWRHFIFIRCSAVLAPPSWGAETIFRMIIYIWLTENIISRKFPTNMRVMIQIYIHYESILMTSQ